MSPLAFFSCLNHTASTQKTQQEVSWLEGTPVKNLPDDSNFKTCVCEVSAPTHNLELQRLQKRTAQPRAMSGITKPSPSAYIKEQKGYWIPTIYTFFCKCPHQSVQPHVSIDCYEVKYNFWKQTRHLCFRSFAKRSSMTEYQDLSGRRQFQHFI